MDIFIVILGILLILCVWIILFDSTRFVKRQYSYSDKRILKPCKAVFLSDLHNKRYGRNNKALLDAIREEKPDFILVGGDMLTADNKRRFDVAIELLRDLKPDFKIYYANGNHEQRLKENPEEYGDLWEIYDKALKDIGIGRIINACEELDEYGIAIYGAEIDYEFFRRFNHINMAEGYMDRLLGKCNEDKYNILLAHNPDFFERYVQWGASLVLSGHIHGGIVRVPFVWRGVISPKFSLFPKYDGGEFADGDARMIVSRGLGTHTIPLRMFNPAELVIIDFKGTDNGGDTR